jgi:hypothetical protein
MPSLAETYALASGAKLDKPIALHHFFSLNVEKYITLQGFSENQSSKNYDYWNEVTSVLSPALEAHGIKIIQLGSKNEPPIAGCIHLMGQTTIKQSNYILSKSLLHLGVDSYCQHVAGAANVPLVVVFGSTDPRNHGAFWKGEHIFLEPHRNGLSTSFGHEHNKSINKIPPEKIINSVLQILKLDIKLNRQSFFFGQKYQQTILEWVPDHIIPKDFANGAPIIARLDYGCDNEILSQVLSSRRLYLISNKQVDLNILLKFKENIDGITFEFSNDFGFDEEYIKKIKSIGIKAQFISINLKDEELNNLRLKYFDLIQIFKVNYKNKDNFVNDCKEYLFLKEFPLITTPPLFKSNKFILSKERIFISKWHLINNKPAESFSHNVSQLIDDEEFWKEQDYFYIFSQQI